jgi:hypothetical protein
MTGRVSWKPSSTTGIASFVFEAEGNRPEAFAVVALSDIVRAGNTGGEDEVPHWLFFDGLEQRARAVQGVDQ